MKILGPPQLATAALSLLNKADVKMDDDSLEVARQIRGMLRGIASGALVVGVPPKAPADAPAPAEEPPATPTPV